MTTGALLGALLFGIVGVIAFYDEESFVYFLLLVVGCAVAGAVAGAVVFGTLGLAFVADQPEPCPLPTTQGRACACPSSCCRG